VNRGVAFCEACRQREGLTDRQARTGSHWSDWNRGTSTERGYGVAWRALRAQVLAAANYQCRPCAAEGFITYATQVHHIKAKADGGTDDVNNLEPVCDACHRRLTAKMAATRAPGGRQSV